MFDKLFDFILEITTICCIIYYQSLNAIEPRDLAPLTMEVRN